MWQLFKFITWRLLVCTAQHVLGVLTPIIRSSTTAVAALVLPLERGCSSAVGRGRAGRHCAVEVRLIHLTPCHRIFFFRFWRHSPPVGQGLLMHEVSRSHTTTHHSRYDSSRRVISSSQRLLPDNTQHSQQTSIRIPGGIRAHNLSRRAAVDLRLRPHGHWDRHRILYDPF